MIIRLDVSASTKGCLSGKETLITFCALGCLNGRWCCKVNDDRVPSMAPHTNTTFGMDVLCFAFSRLEYKIA